MVWWQTLVVALASSIVGGVLTSAGTYLINREQQRAQRRQREAEAVAAALTALRELDPEVYGDRLRDERAPELMADKRLRWLAAAGQLELLAATHPGTEIATLAESVLKRGDLLVIRLDERVGATTEISLAWLDAIPKQHGAAVEDARRLARLIAGS